MDDFICNPGLAFLASHIFDQLDICSLVRCRLVCRNWRRFIDCQKFTWVKILQSVTAAAEMKKWLGNNKVYHDFVKAAAAAETKKYREDTKKLATLFSKFKPGCHISPLHQSASTNDWESVMFLIKRLDLNPMKALEEDPQANTPAHLCAKDTDAVKYLISSGNVSAFSKAKNRIGQTPLHLAAAAGNLGAYKVMVNHNRETGDAVNPTDDDGTTPLHEACRSYLHRGCAFTLQKVRLRLYIVCTTGVCSSFR